MIETPLRCGKQWGMEKQAMTSASTSHSEACLHSAWTRALLRGEEEGAPDPLVRHAVSKNDLLIADSKHNRFGTTVTT